MIGKKVGDWLIVEEIGDGGHAFVFKGTHEGEEVAIKMLKPSAASEDNLEKRFKIEAEALKTLEHPNIVGFKDYVFQNGYHYLVLEFMDAGSVDHILRAMGPIETRYAVPIFNQVLLGVAHAHSFGYLHRDMKPNNILMNKRGQAKLTDFGIAKVLGGEALTKKGFVLGTTAYMAPEYLTLGRDSEQMDVYALGVTFYELLTTRKPYEFEREDEPLAQFASRVMKEPPTPPSAYRPVPPELERIILKAIERDPKRRYKTAERFRQDIVSAFPDLVNRPIQIRAGKAETNLLEMPVMGERVDPTPVVRASQLKRLPALLVTAGLAAIVAVAGVLLGWTPMTIAIATVSVLAVGTTVGLMWLRRRVLRVAPPPSTVMRRASPVKSEEVEEQKATPSKAEPKPTKAVAAAAAAQEGDRIPFFGEFQNNAPAAMTSLSELSAFLVVTAGTEKGKRFGLRPISRIGRDLRFDIRPHDAEISRQHAVVTFDGSGFSIRDIGSANGTFVNEKRLTGEQPLGDGDIIRIGRTSLRFEYVKP